MAGRLRGKKSISPSKPAPVVIRGLTAVPKPGGTGEVLWFVTSGKVRRLDPAAAFKETIELDELAFLTEKLGVTVTRALSAYNELMPYVMPGTGETLWLFGFQCSHPAAVVNSNPDIKARLQMSEPSQARRAAGKARAGDVRRGQGGQRALLHPPRQRGRHHL